MNLNLLPCYQIVCSEGRYYLSRWDAVSKKYECLQETDEIPLSVGNCIVFHSENPLQQERKLYGVWWVDERNGRCIIGNMLFSRWMYCEGNFLCAHRGENTGSEQWEMIIPHENHQCLSRISLGQMIGSEKYKCFVNDGKGNKKILSYFPRGYCQRGLKELVEVDECRTTADGRVCYRIGSQVYSCDEFSLPDGSKGWRFLKDFDAMEKWNKRS